MSKPKYLRIRDARANFSNMVSSVGRDVAAFVIGLRDNPKAILIDIETAEKYLPNDYKKFQVPDTKNKKGKLFYAKTSKWLSKQKKHPSKKLENISNNIDKILYGR